MSEAAATVTVQPVADGVEIHAVAEDGRVIVLRLADDEALTLADDVTRACERRVMAAA